MRERSIIHINIADFAVAVERALDRRLQDRPVIIAPQGQPRATVYDMSEEAFQQGVRKGMQLKKALCYCRKVTVISPHPDRYERAMAMLFKHARPYSPQIEITDHNGHLFLDTTGTGKLLGPPPDLAWRIRKAVRADLGIDPIWSVAPNKLIAKVATRMVKPNGEYIIHAGEEPAFLKPLPLYLIPGIESEDLKQLQEFNLTRAGQVARLSMAQLDMLVGPRSANLYEAVRGIDPSPVYSRDRIPPRLTADYEFLPDTHAKDIVEGILYYLVEQVGVSLRRQRLAAQRMGMVVDYADGKRIIRQAVAHPATANDLYLFAVAKLALNRAWTRRTRIRHLRLICDRLTYPPAQLELFPECAREPAPHTNLMVAMDMIRHRFGADAIRVGRTLPVLPL